MNKQKRISQSLFNVRSYFVIFLLIAFVVTCSFLLFMGVMDRFGDDIRLSAIITFGNAVLLSILLCLIYGFWRKYTVERPVKRILAVTQMIIYGDFSVRIEPFHSWNKYNEFDIIIENFNKMMDEISGLETFQSDFIANITHELKTPLAVIQSYSTVIQEENLSEQVNEYAQTITEASRKLSALITNILKLNKLENQEIFPDYKDFYLSEQLRHCVLQFENIWEDKQLSFEIDIDDVKINCDESLLELVWNNLISNAIKFTDTSGLVSVSLKERDGMIVVNVSDTGCGMSTEIGAHIFEKFYQGDTSRAREGNGLGLALVKKVIDIVGGEISVESQVDKGSTFVVKLKG